jgi:hypothetical protein
VKASDAVTKNQAPAIDIIMFQIRRRAERRLEAPELLPGRQAERPGRLVEVGRDGLQRLVEAEGHVPRLCGEGEEHRRELGARHIARRQRHEPGERESQIAEHRDRLQDVEQRDQHDLGVPALGRQRRVGQREDQRGGEPADHPKAGAQGVLRQPPGIETDRRLRQRGQRRERLPGAVRDGQEHAENQRRGDQIPDVERRAQDRVRAAQH